VDYVIRLGNQINKENIKVREIHYNKIGTNLKDYKDTTTMFKRLNVDIKYIKKKGGGRGILSFLA